MTNTNTSMDLLQKIYKFHYKNFRDFKLKLTEVDKIVEMTEDNTDPTITNMKNNLEKYKKQLEPLVDATAEMWEESKVAKKNARYYQKRYLERTASDAYAHLFKYVNGEGSLEIQAMLHYNRQQAPKPDPTLLKDDKKIRLAMKRWLYFTNSFKLNLVALKTKTKGDKPPETFYMDIIVNENGKTTFDDPLNFDITKVPTSSNLEVFSDKELDFINSIYVRASKPDSKKNSGAKPDEKLPDPTPEIIPGAEQNKLSREMSARGSLSSKPRRFRSTFTKR